MKKRFAPEQHCDLIIGLLTNQDQPAYGQVATVDAEGKPRLRTVHLRYIEEAQTVGFVTHMASPKWQELSNNGRLAGCYYSPIAQVQLRFQAAVRQVQGTSQHEQEQAMLKRRWLAARPDVRASYWAEYQADPGNMQSLAPKQTDQPCPTFGMLVCLPDMWEVYQLTEGAYQQGQRTVYRMTAAGWREQAVSLTSSRGL